MDQSTDDSIRNNPSFAKLEKEIGSMQAISKIVSFLDRLGIRHDLHVCMCRHQSIETNKNDFYLPG